MLDCVRTTQARPAVRSLERLAETLPASVHVLYAGSAMIRQVCERAKWNPGKVALGGTLLNAFERFVFPSLMQCLETSILGTTRRWLPVPHAPAKVYKFRTTPFIPS